MNANRYLGINNTKLSKSLEKLSSGYAINRAGDNAAGLAVSEKMRSQIAGMEQGVKNAQDAISMIQTFEGALTETDSILQRMKVLADQAGNGTYQNEVDRDAINLEFNQLNDELNQIADTDFNGVTALNGGVMSDGTVANNTYAIADRPVIQYTQNGQGASAVVYSSGVSGTIDSAGNGTFNILGVQVTVKGGESQTVDGADGAYEPNIENGTSDESSYTVTGLKYKDGEFSGKITATEVFEIGKETDTTITIFGTTYTLDQANGALYDQDGNKITKINGGSVEVTAASTADGVTKPGTVKISDMKFTVEENGTITATDNNESDTIIAVGSVSLSQGVSTPDAYQHGSINLTYANDITFQVGARSKDAVKFNFAYTTNGIGNLKSDLNASARGLGTDQLSLATQEEANFAVDKIDNAINKVSMIRATFGAAQNRLEHKIDNLNVSVENLTSAESAIRDTDMPTEMMNFTKQQILAQASQSMLAQANQLPQSVLSLLQ